MEMLEGGFTSVAEFHYLHHDRDGRPFAALGEMAARIAAAAAETGIGLTLLPSFYAYGGFGAAPAHAGQRRFLNDPDRFLRLVEEARHAIAALPDAVVGMAPHSLRAVTPATLRAVLDGHTSGPIHIHAAEQVREVEDCVAWSGERPVAWLLSHAAVDDRWCLIHATHMSADESRRLAASGAVAGLCPLTEANLGDGIFDAPTLCRRARTIRHRHRFQHRDHGAGGAQAARIPSTPGDIVPQRPIPHGRQVDRRSSLR